MGSFSKLAAPGVIFPWGQLIHRRLFTKLLGEDFFYLWKLLWCKQLKKRVLGSCLSGDNRELMQGLFAARLRMQARVRAGMGRPNVSVIWPVWTFRKATQLLTTYLFKNGNLSVFLSMIMIIRLITLAFLVKTLPCSLESLWLCLCYSLYLKTLCEFVWLTRSRTQSFMLNSFWALLTSSDIAIIFLFNQDW